VRLIKSESYDRGINNIQIEVEHIFDTSEQTMSQFLLKPKFSQFWY
jgi:hypothetical protein